MDEEVEMLTNGLTDEEIATLSDLLDKIIETFIKEESE